MPLLVLYKGFTFNLSSAKSLILFCFISRVSMAKSELSNQTSERRLPPSPKVAPWLVTRHGKNCKFQTFYNLSDPLNTSYKKFISELSGKRFWQKNCHQGWLIIVDDEDYGPKVDTADCYLWDPVSLKIIMLPSLQNFKQSGGYRIKDCLLSSPPQSSGGNGDGIEGGSLGDDSTVYILYDGGGSPDILIYCHPGEKQWRKHEFVDKIGRLETMFYFKGKLYIMCMSLELLEITRQQDGSIGISDLITKNEIGLFKLERVGGTLGYCLQSYYMESFGEVFRISRYCIRRGNYAHFITQIVISKLDFDSLTWAEAKILDDHVFFVDYYNDTRLSCLASELGLSKGCVYFTLAYDLSMYKYDLEDETVLLSIPCPDIPTPWLPPRWLMIPTTSRIADGRTTDLEKDEELEIVKATECRTNDEDNEKKNIKEARLLVDFRDDIVWAVSNFLHRVDCIHLRAVSKKYHSIIDLRRCSSTTTVQTTDASPWLFFPKNGIFNSLNPMHNNEEYLLNIPELLKGSRIRFSKGGWLLMSKCMTVFFYNPFTKSTIRLPDLPDFQGYDFTGISFSSLPTASDCLVFAIDKDMLSNQVHIFFIKRGEKDWSYNLYNGSYLPPNMKNMDFQLTLNNPVFYHGKFYCLDNNGTLGVFKYGHPDMCSWEILSMIAPPNCGFIYNSFLVECDEKLMSVLLGRLGNWVRIFRLCETKMAWVEVEHLGRYMLFLSSTSCISAPAPTRQMENKIYFPRMHNQGILYCSLDTSTYHSVGSRHSAKDYRDSKEKLHCSWIEPNWSKISDHHLDWLNI